jgi:perosamine synthetase
MDRCIKVAHPVVGEEEFEAIREVLLSGNYVSGKRVEEFEHAFAQYVGCVYAVAVSNGTAALHIALEAMGVGPGDEIIVPPLTFFATVSSVLYLRAVPVFADIDPDDLCLSPSDTANKITPRTRAIIPVHLFGNAAKMDAFLALSQTTGVPIVEDCAQAHGTEFDGRKVGVFGRAGCFSFFATKHMTTGEGGMITTDDAGLAKRARILRNHGMVGRDHHVMLGFNHRMTEMEAAMGLVQLRKLDDLNSRRIAHSEFLLREASALPWACVPAVSERVKHTYFWCPLMVNEEGTGKRFQDLKAHLKENHVEFRQRYEEPLYRQEVLRRLFLDYSGVCLPHVERIAGKVLGLPNHPWLTRQDLDRIVDVLRAF